MPLQLFAFHTRPHAFAVTKTSAALEECVFLLDFTRPLERLRWFGVQNKWIGLTTGLLVPVVHQGEQAGGYVFGISAGEPYFSDIQELWQKHRGAQVGMKAEAAEPMQIVADFANHFPTDC